MTNAQEKQKAELQAGAVGEPYSSTTGWVGEWRYYTVSRICSNCKTRGWSAETHGEERRARIECPTCGLEYWGT